VPLLKLPDGIELHAEQLGEGPLVVIAPYWSGVPESVQPFIDEMSQDHAVVLYDARGTGRSTRRGPHDMETGAADLEAVIEAFGDSAVVVAFADSANRAVRVAARRPDLVEAVISPGALPLGRKSLRGFESLAGSETVLGALIDTVENYHASAMRNIISSANPQMSEEEIRERVERLVRYCPREVAVERLQGWIDDEPQQYARAIGDRLVVLLAPGAVTPWFPDVDQMRSVAAKQVPEAVIELIDDGLVSRPDIAAAIVRRLTEPLRVQTA
jgi:pimeloyl-ACP methyl ester carboxylesterase